MIWYVHRNGGPGTAISSAHQYLMEGYNDETLDDASSAELQAFLAAAAPPPRKPSPREWLERLSAEKQAAIAAAGASNSAILLWLLKAAGAQIIDVGSQETIDGVAALVTAGVLTAEDRAVLLAT